jgi:hypothetical protein
VNKTKNLETEMVEKMNRQIKPLLCLEKEKADYSLPSHQETRIGEEKS